MPNYPDFESDYLQQLASSLRAKSKSITFHAPNWTCSREVEPDSTERFNIDAVVSTTQYRLSVWETQEFFFRACRADSKQGWDLMLSFEGDCQTTSVEMLVEKFKESLRMPESELTKMWQNISLQTDN
jgi:hypothetical protein